MILELDLNENLKITLEKSPDDVTSSASDARKQQTELLMKLVDKKAQKAAALARKVIRWPIGQTLPNQMTYSVTDEHLLVVGPTSEAVVPLARSKIDALTATSITKSSTSSKTKTFSSFNVNPTELFDINSVSKSVQNVIESPEKEKRWKQLAEKLADCSDGQANGALSAIEQTQLVEAVRKYAEDADSDAETVRNVLAAILESRILTFRMEDTLLRFCVQIGQKSVVEKVMEDQKRAVSEFILVELLKIAVKNPSETRHSQVLQLLSRSFSKRSMTEAAGEILTASEAIAIMESLTEIYKESFEADISGKALSLITILMDSHGSRIVYEDNLHVKFAAISNFIIEMQSLVGTFARLESTIDDNVDLAPPFNTVIRITPTVHPLNW